MAGVGRGKENEWQQRLSGVQAFNSGCADNSRWGQVLARATARTYATPEALNGHPVETVPAGNPPAGKAIPFIPALSLHFGVRTRGGNYSTLMGGGGITRQEII